MDSSDLSLQKLPPHSLDAERAVIGAILLDNNVLDIALETLSPEHFHETAHRLIYSAILNLNENNDRIDLVTLVEELTKTDRLTQVGGTAYLASILDATPTASNILSYAQIVKDKALRRKLINIATQATLESYDETSDVSELLLRTENQFNEVSEESLKADFSPLADLVNDSFKMIEGLYDNKGSLNGLSTGFTDFDALTAGLHPSELIIVAARPSMGKTSLCINIAEHVAKKEKAPVAIFSLETSKEQLLFRMMCAEAMVDAQKVRHGYISNHDWPLLSRAAGTLAETPIYIDDTPTITPLEMRAKARQLKKKVPNLGLILVDYLQLMQGDGKYENRQQEISRISRSLKALARELNVPLIALSQLSRAVESRRPPRPMLSDLRESGAIEQDADLVAFIYREDMYKRSTGDDTDEDGLSEIIIGKQRNGPVGIVKLVFQKKFTKFVNFIEEDETF
ncbi:MAG: replicative DNA helicase [bacterium]